MLSLVLISNKCQFVRHALKTLSAVFRSAVLVQKGFWLKFRSVKNLGNGRVPIPGLFLDYFRTFKRKKTFVSGDIFQERIDLHYIFKYLIYGTGCSDSATEFCL